MILIMFFHFIYIFIYIYIYVDGVINQVIISWRAPSCINLSRNISCKVGNPKFKIEKSHQTCESSPIFNWGSHFLYLFKQDHCIYEILQSGDLFAIGF